MALKEKELVELLETFDDYLHLSGPFSHFFREIGWLINRCLLWVSDSTEKLLNSVFSLSTFVGSSKISAFISEWKSLIFAIGTIGLILFCYRYMRDKNVTKQNFFDNLILGLAVAMIMSTALVTVTSTAFDTAKLIRSKGGTSSQAVFKSNITDLLQYDDTDWKSASLEETNNIPVGNIKYLKINEQLKAKDDRLTSDKSKEILKKKINVGFDGKTISEKNDKGMFKWDELYYRYSWHPWVIGFTLIITIVVNVLTSFKYIRIIYELAFNQIIAVFFSLQNFTDAGKLNKILQAIVNLLTAVILMALSLRVFHEFTAYVTSKNLGMMNTLMITIGLALAVIDGPAIIQELTGVDGGVKSTGMGLLGMGATAFGAAKLAKSGIDLGKKAGKKFGDVGEKVGKEGLKAAAFGAGFSSGMSGGSNDLSEFMDKKGSSGNEPSSIEEEMKGKSSESSTEDSEAPSNENSEGQSKDNSQSIEGLESDMANQSHTEGETDGLEDRLASTDGTEEPNESLEEGMANHSNLHGEPTDLETDMTESRNEPDGIEVDKEAKNGLSEPTNLESEQQKATDPTNMGPKALNPMASHSLQEENNTQPNDETLNHLAAASNQSGTLSTDMKENAAIVNAQAGQSPVTSITNEMKEKAQPNVYRSESQSALSGKGGLDQQNISIPASINYPPSFNRESANEQMKQALADKPLSPPTSHTLPEALKAAATNKLTDAQVGYSNRVSESKTLEEISRNNQIGKNTGKKVKDWLGDQMKH